jgi:type I restriction enzyme, S subunit
VNKSKTQTLGGLCDLVTVQIDPAMAPGALYLGLEHLTPGRLVRSGRGSASDVQSHKFAFRKGDVLYGKLRPYLDKAVLADSDGICTTELLVLRPKHDIDPRFVACLVHAQEFIDHAMAGVTGAHHPRTSWNHVSQFSITDFDKREQGKIATLLWSVQDLLVASESALESAEKVKRAATRELFTRGLRGEPRKDTEIGLIPESWDVRQCEDASEDITVGVVVKPASYYVMRGVPAFRSLNIKEDRIDDSDLVYFSDHDSNTILAKSKLRTGDVLVVRTGYPGTSCVVPEKFAGANCIDLVIVRPRQDLVRAGFLSRFLNSDWGKSQALANSHGLAQKHLNVGAVRQLKIPIPNTLDEQFEIVAILEAIDRKIELHRQKRMMAETLFKVLLHKLMAGVFRVGDLDLSALQGNAEALVA